MALALITPPAVQPVSLATVKRQVRPDGDVDDLLLALYIGAARGLIEGPQRIYELALITQTWEWSIDAFPTCPPYVLKFPLRPVQSIVSITYAGGAAPLPSEGYQADLISDPPRLFPPAGGTWPVASAVPNAVAIRFVAGFGSAEANIPEDIINPMLLTIGLWYDHRDGLGENGAELALPLQARQMLHNYWRPYV